MVSGTSAVTKQISNFGMEAMTRMEKVLLRHPVCV